MAEKGPIYASGESASYAADEPKSERVASIAHRKGVKMGEAADAYGDIQTAEEYGYVTRGYVLETSLYSSFIALTAS